jgi:hypothetical protein
MNILSSDYGYITLLYCRYALLIYVLIVNIYSYMTQIFCPWADFKSLYTLAEDI